MPGFLGLVPAWAWRWIAIAVVAAAFGGWAWIKGNEHGTEKLTEYIGKQAVQTVRIADARLKISKETEYVYVPVLQKIYVQGKNIEKEVKVYVTQADDAGCAVPNGFVREYNAAWAGALAGPPAESDRGASGVPLSTVAETDAHNATSCLAYKAQRDGLIEFYRKQQAVK